MWNAHVCISCMMTGRKKKESGNRVAHGAIDSVALGFVCFFEGFLRLFQFVWTFLCALLLFVFFSLSRKLRFPSIIMSSTVAPWFRKSH